MAPARMQPRVAWFLAARPQTLPAGIVPVVLATALAYADHQVRPWAALWAGLGAMAIQIATNLFNDWADFYRGADTAARLGPMRVTQAGHISPKHVLLAACGCFLAAAGCGLNLIAFGGWPIVLVGVVSIAAGVAYTGGPYPLAYHGLGDVFVVVFFGWVATCATYYLHTGTVTTPSFALGTAVGFFANAILVVNNLRDRHTDAQAHKRTLVVRFGPTFGRAHYSLCLAVPYAMAVVLELRTPVGHAYVLPLLTLPIAAWLVHRVWRTEGAALNPMLGATARTEALFAVSVAVGFYLWT
jgi:1,4-dihydroxy-2-naphthoate octaprenyltransferase